MGASYGKKGQHDRAIELCGRALHICHAVLGPHHPQTQQTEESLAYARSNAAQYILLKRAFHRLGFRV
jgi:hypothetical protein